MTLDVLLLLQGHEIYNERVVERIESQKIISFYYFIQGKTIVAEQSMREALKMIVDQQGTNYSWVPEFKNVLEGWLRSWGREEDVNTLWEEIEELIGNDESDEKYGEE